MVIGILAKKLGMTQVFSESGRMLPVTVLQAGPCTITQIKTEEKDGYNGVQVAFGDVKEKHVNKPRMGHFAKAGVAPKKYVRELPVDGIENLAVGQEIKADIFNVGEMVKVTGISKGKGFAGVMKRWNFGGAETAHGSMHHRKPGSGGAMDAARTFKGVKRPGQLGNVKVTQRGLTVYAVDADKNLILVIGSVPGSTGGLVLVARQTVGG